MENILGITRKADIKFYASGKIEISAQVAKQLDISAGDKLNIGVENGEYYIYVSKNEGLRGRHEAVCWPTNPGGKHLRAYSKRMCDIMMRNSTGHTANHIVGAPVKHPILGMMLPIIASASCASEIRGKR